MHAIHAVLETRRVVAINDGRLIDPVISVIVVVTVKGSAKALAHGLGVFLRMDGAEVDRVAAAGEKRRLFISSVRAYLEGLNQ